VVSWKGAERGEWRGPSQNLWWAFGGGGRRTERLSPWGRAERRIKANPINSRFVENQEYRVNMHNRFFVPDFLLTCIMLVGLRRLLPIIKPEFGRQPANGCFFCNTITQWSKNCYEKGTIVEYFLFMLSILKFILKMVLQ